MNIVRAHDGERFVAALEVNTGTKYRHVVTITEGGVRLLQLPLDEAVAVLGPVKRKHMATFRRAGKTFGITKAAEEALATVQL